MPSPKPHAPGEQAHQRLGDLLFTVYLVPQGFRVVLGDFDEEGDSEVAHTVHEAVAALLARHDGESLSWLIKDWHPYYVEDANHVK